MFSGWAIVLLVLMLFAFWRFWFFFRNPKRVIQENDSLLLAPADGFVVYVRSVQPGEPVVSIKQGRELFLDELTCLQPGGRRMGGTLIGIYMSPFDVHYNRAPMYGTIQKIWHGFPKPPNKNKSLFHAQSNLLFDISPLTWKCDYLAFNERATYRLENSQHTIYLIQIADQWVRRIVTLVNAQPIAQGEIFGLIRMGSQVDLFIPDTNGPIDVLVCERQRVKAGLTPLVRWRNEEGSLGLEHAKAA